MNVYFTVDTESSMGGAFQDASRRPLPAERMTFCRIGSREYGIGLLVEALSRFGFRGTYFVETLITFTNGEQDMAPVFDYLLARGQDVQLHAHPVYYFYARRKAAQAKGLQYSCPDWPDGIGRLSEPLQLEVLELAAAQFRKLAGYAPSAFRAGSFAASTSTLRCLRKLDIRLDTSFNPCYPDLSFPGEALAPNRVECREDVWELPVTVGITAIPEGQTRFRHADPSVVSVEELRSMLETAAGCGQKHFVILFHSFSAVKASDMWYTNMRPNQLVIHRLHKLLAYLASRPDLYQVKTFQDLAQSLDALSPESPPLPRLGWFHSTVRKTMQGINRWYWL
jgi:hypothetical protein